MSTNQKKERTEAQKLAARINGAKSRGPVTPEGKAISAQNATRHGFTARRVVLDSESPEAWDDFLAALTEEWNPQTPTELQLVHDLASARWRLNRLLDIETESLNVEIWREDKSVDECVPHATERTRTALAWQTLQKDGTLAGIHRHELRLRRIVRDSLSQLVAIHDARTAAAEAAAAAVQNEPEPATSSPQPGGAQQNEPRHSSAKHEPPRASQQPDPPKRPPAAPPSGLKAA